MESAIKHQQEMDGLDETNLKAYRWTIEGRVQGVGFRPFVYRLAQRLGLTGKVWNQGGSVFIEAQGTSEHLAQFGNRLIQDAPMIASAHISNRVSISVDNRQQFKIETSQFEPTQSHRVPPDYGVCDECLTEMRAPHNRRYRYPFINCTQCGPRYTIIDQLPYDRPFTSLKDFPLCPECDQEYRTPVDRRFHAQPIACPDCGPQLAFSLPGQSSIIKDDNEAALSAAIELLNHGKIVAVKGIGGYHLMVDALNVSAVERLRHRKHRPHKPFAVMFPYRGSEGLSAVREYVIMNDKEARKLQSQERPIVLVNLRKDSKLPETIAPGLTQVGALLPYSPLHHLLLDALDRPMVATSANLSGDPVLTDNSDTETRLAGIADAFLHHNRPIRRPADDSVYRYIAQRLRPLRLGRGSSPLELELPFSISSPLLAMGAQQKNTLCLAWDNRLVLSPHIGDLNNYRSQQLCERTASELPMLYGVEIQQLVCDAHPDYHTSRYSKYWAKTFNKTVHKVFHHYAHAAALCGEHGRFDEDTLVFTWDGTGLGLESELWGGEALLGRPGHWQRRASFRQFPLLGGERAIRETWRIALALCWEADVQWQPGDVNKEDLALLNTAWQRQINCPRTSSVGRLFDAASTLLGLVNVSTYDAQGPMVLENMVMENIAASKTGRAIKLPQHKDDTGVLCCDWKPLLHHLLDRRYPVAERAADFHSTLADALLTQALDIRAAEGINCVGLTGGVFQNKLLTELAATLLMKQGFDVILPERIPGNDAGISYGQIMEVLAQQAQTHIQCTEVMHG